MDIEKLKKHLEETPIEELQKEWDEIVKQFPSEATNIIPLVKEMQDDLSKSDATILKEKADGEALALKAIELATQLKYGSKQSREYLEKAKKLIK